MAAIEIADLVQAQLIVDLPGDTSAPTVVAQAGFTGTAARSAAGVYEFDLEDASIDADGLLALLGAGPAAAVVTAELVAGTPNQLVLRTFAPDTGLAADIATRVAAEVHRLPARE